MEGAADLIDTESGMRIDYPTLPLDGTDLIGTLKHDV
jgi:hypothetical protein